MSVRKIALLVVVLVVAAVGGLAVWKIGPAFMPTRNVEAGIAVGQDVPVEMELRDGAGEVTTLAANMGPNGMALFLVRSAAWCPHCKGQLIRTEEIRGAIAERGYSLANLSYDEPRVLAEFAANKGIGYTMFSDTGSRMIDALGLRDPQYKPGSKAFGVPRASILVLAPDGRVKARHVSEDFRSRPSNADVLTMVGGVSD